MIVQGVWEFLNVIFDDAATVMESYGLHQKSLVLLALLDRADTPQGLAHLLRTPPSTLSHMLSELERRKLIERSLDADDKRKFRLRRTEDGQQALEEGIAAINRAMATRMERLAPSECATMAESLKLIHEFTNAERP